ncbi:MGH1-like glycoside hydrolase domain-containing protein [Dyadobacter psychrotolerans]|uniref:Glycoside hydrolase n=1 Tax=Dyadobacter psychrotolerans TaxID=2541721 RepID=A0A4R5E0F0_9BACT|nr:trehalase family glycosidase [Dyadobacter psychrotolerans]TDE17225.1 glycoside hydrolase [Dyadobacter psychrotolerans]
MLHQRFLVFLFCFLFASAGFTQQINTSSKNIDFTKLHNSHDVSLSPWGPYSKKYAGVSHIPDITSGMRFDFSVMPAYYRNKVLIPNVRFESGYFPWEFSRDLHQFTYRYELEWKDKVFVDVTYTVRDSSTVLVKMRSVNNTDLPQNLAMNLMAFIEYPENAAAKKISVASDAKWYNAMSYQSLTFAKKTARDNLVYDGWLRGEVRQSDLIDGRGVGKGFGETAGDSVSYGINVSGEQLKGKLSLLYKVKKGAVASFRLSGLVQNVIELKGTGSPEKFEIPFSAKTPGVVLLTMVAEGSASAEINGFVVSGQSQKEPFKIESQVKAFSPKAEENLSSKNLILKYGDINSYYGIGWDNRFSEVREFRNSELDIFFKNLVHNHVEKVFTGDREGSYSNVFIRPIEVLPHSEVTSYAVICNGNYDQVKELLAKYDLSKEDSLESKAPVENPDNSIIAEGKKYLFSQKMMQAALLSNVVYPVYTQNSYIRNFTPGKWWNSLYTWDSGFIALGMNTVNERLAAEVINAYTTPPGSQSAFIHHGSPLPVQVYAFFDLWNKTQSKELLAYFYPRLRQLYLFTAGKFGSSTIGSLKSGLLKTWDYFYNSAGWDDYPPQVGVHAQKLEDTTSPVSNTAHAIRVAKILRIMALKLGLDSDVKEYDQDIARFTTALQKYSWDKKSGYFSYVKHDKEGNAVSFFNYEPGNVNFNMGLDGVSPLLAGICTVEQQNVLVDKLFSPQHLWTTTGISAVDQSAPYYKTDGYWNGSVWMPHQWFMWKALLDIGKPELAYKLAKKALDVWKTETDASYYTFEHFLVKSGRGAGWHQFSGLSAPVLAWFSSYYKVGTVTAGFETVIEEQSFVKDYTAFKAKLSFDGATKAHVRTLLVCMNPAKTYQVVFGSKNVKFSVLNKGLLQIELPATNEPGLLEVKSFK